MSKWETEATTSTFDANSQISNQTGGRNRDSYSGSSAGYSTLNASDGSYYDNMNDGWGFDTHDKGANGHMYGEYTEKGFFGGKEVTGYNIVGINGNDVPKMREQIELYVQSVQDYLEDAITATREQISTAFRGGEAEKAVDAYLDKVKNYVHNVVSTLNAFSDKLADVGNAWVKAQSNVASNVNAATGSFSEGSAYTADLQYGGASR